MGKKEDSYSGLFFRFLKFGFLAFGGPIAQISLMREELVEKEKWMDPNTFSKVLSVYQLLPGPEATELAVHFGYLRKGRLGSVISGLGFILPGFFIMLIISFLYHAYGASFEWANALLYGIKAAAMAMIIWAIYRISMASIKTRLHLLLSSIAFFSTLFFDVSFAILIFMAVFAAFLFGDRRLFAILPLGAYPMAKSKLFLIFMLSLEAGLLTFGGAYTSIPFLEKGAVVENGWLSPQQFLDGVGFVNTVPTPLIMLGTFVGYLAGGFWAAVISTIGIFLPAFCFTLFGYNKILSVLDNQKLQFSIGCVTASVIGLIGASSVRLFPSAVPDYRALLIMLLCAYSLWHRKLSPAYLIIVSSIIGFVLISIGL
ncbi:MAG: chromate efflux transporter [Candidatus Aenigmarchaeota archaeon]|nr:chromate efflux transporter [Candidatus Aenigmarchaeota archaeon]